MNLPQFDSSARVVIECAHAEARRFGHDYLGTEHLLLGLLTDADDPIAQVLLERGLNPPAIRRRILEMVGAGPDAEEGLQAATDVPATDIAAAQRAVVEAFGPGQEVVATRRRGWLRRRGSVGDTLPLASGETVVLRPGVKEVLAHSDKVAQRMGKAVVGSRHILLGLLEVQRALVNDLFDLYGVDRERVRRAVLEDIAG